MWVFKWVQAVFLWHVKAQGEFVKTRNLVPPPLIGRELALELGLGHCHCFSIEDCLRCFHCLLETGDCTLLTWCVRKQIWSQNGKKQSCSKLPEMARKLIENYLLIIYLTKMLPFKFSKILTQKWKKTKVVWNCLKWR